VRLPISCRHGKANRQPICRNGGLVLLLAALLACAVCPPSAVRAQWKKEVNSGTHRYLDTSNWQGGTIDDNFSSNLALTGALSVTLDDNYTTVPGGLRFNFTFTTGGAYPLSLLADGPNRTLTLAADVCVGPSPSAYGDRIVTVGGGPFVLTTLLGANRDITVATTADTLTFANSINNGTGTNGIIKSGDGTLIFSGVNGYTGTTNVQGGTLRLGDNDRIHGTSAVVLANTKGVVFDLSGHTDTVGSLAGGGPEYGNVTLGAGGCLTTGGDNTTRTYDGTVSGSGGKLIKIGTGTMTLTNPNSDFSGRLEVSDGTLSVGALANVNTASSIGKGSAGGSAADLVINGGTLQYTGATAQSTNRLFTIGAGGATLDASGAATGALIFTGAGSIAFSSAAAPTSLTLTGTGTGTAGGSLTSVLADPGSNANVLSLTKSGAGTWTLAGASTYTGATTISAGTLALGASGSIAHSATINVTSPGIFDVSAVTGGYHLASGQTLKATGTVSGAMTVDAGATLRPGASPGTLATAGQTWANNGNYHWMIYDATGAAGAGYSTLAITGGLNLSALTSGGFKINLWSLSGLSPDTNGAAINFNNANPYSWTLASTTTGVTGFNAGNFIINTAANNGAGGFTNDLGGGTFGLSVSGHNLLLNFTPAAPTIVSATWQTGSGQWSTPGNWLPGLPTNAADTANFTGKSAGAVTVDVDLPQTTGHLVFNNADGIASYSIGGDTKAVLTLSNTGGVGNATIAATAGSHVVTSQVKVAATDLDIGVSGTGSLNLSGVVDNTAAKVVKATQAGSGTLALGNVINDGAGVLDVLSGTVSAGAISGGGSTQVGGSLTADSIVQGTLSIGAGGSVTIRPTIAGGAADMPPNTARLAGGCNRDATEVPEPATFVLLGAAALILALWHRRQCG